jgi:hypothetical protein
VEGVVVVENVLKDRDNPRLPLRQRLLAAEIEMERDQLKARVAELEKRLRAVERYADGLHFAGRLEDEKLVRAALGAGGGEP